MCSVLGGVGLGVGGGRKVRGRREVSGKSSRGDKEIDQVFDVLFVEQSADFPRGIVDAWNMFSKFDPIFFEERACADDVISCLEDRREGRGGSGAGACGRVLVNKVLEVLARVCVSGGSLGDSRHDWSVDVFEPVRGFETRFDPFGWSEGKAGVLQGVFFVPFHPVFYASDFDGRFQV